MSGQEQSSEDMVRAVYSFAGEQMRNGNSAQQVEALLVQKGLDQESASTVVTNLVNARSKVLREHAKKNMLHGALWCVGGIVVTAVTYCAASGGGTYVVAWGAIIFGAIQFFRGVGQMNG